MFLEKNNLHQTKSTIINFKCSSKSCFSKHWFTLAKKGSYSHTNVDGSKQRTENSALKNANEEKAILQKSLVDKTFTVDAVPTHCPYSFHFLHMDFSIIYIYDIWTQTVLYVFEDGGGGGEKILGILGRGRLEWGGSSPYSEQ